MISNASALRQELLTDPSGIGYSTFINIRDLNRLSDLLNTVGNGSVVVGSVNADMLQRNVVANEYLGLTAAQRNLWDIIIYTGTNSVAISNTNIRTQIGAVWSATTVTRSNLSNLQSRSASRIEVLFGENERADPNIIDLALRG